MLGSSARDDAAGSISPYRVMFRFVEWQHSDFEQIGPYRAISPADIDGRAANPCVGRARRSLLSGARS